MEDNIDETFIYKMIFLSAIFKIYFEKLAGLLIEAFLENLFSLLMLC